ncbi:MAG TPA: lamin tail domain-containing protein [Candidatus Paceibacterota bacterium]|nr:lamin tail domain-containing protein [Candidatus Paceibacterota bacterium]
MLYQFGLLVILALMAARVEADPLGPSSRRTCWVISEIMFHPASRPAGKNLEFIEIYNAQLVAEDLGGHRLSGEIEFEFPRPTLVPAGGFVVVAPAPGDVQSVFGISGVLGGFTHQLSNQKGTVRLLNPAGAVLLEVTYSDCWPWPVAADGAGHSLVLAHPSYGEGDPRAWTASRYVDGSPGRREPEGGADEPVIVINEILARTEEPALDFVEIYNYSQRSVDLSDWVITDDPATNRFRLPKGTMIGPSGFLALDERQLGFALSASGESLYLFDAGGYRVMDAIRYGPQSSGVAFGRYPDGAPSFQELDQPTPSQSNARPLVRTVVINELLYHPISGDDEDQFVELHNYGPQAMAVGGWRLEDGIQFTIPSGTVIPAGGFLVVAKNMSRLLANYSQLNTSNVCGNFLGALSHRGERIALAMPIEQGIFDPGSIDVTQTEYAVVDEVTYGEGGQWGRWSDGGGSSLELVDPRGNRRLAAHWADSDERGKSRWTLVETTGTLDHGTGTMDSLQLFLQGEGECLIDDVEVRFANGGNLVANASFDAGLGGWVAQGTQAQSSWESSEGFGTPGCLHVRAVARGDTGANRVRTTLTSSLSPGGIGTLRARVRWLCGHPEILMRLRGNYLEAFSKLDVPLNPGTPGLPNSRALSNIGPAISDMRHQPVLPSSMEPVVVTARIDDPDRVGGVRLKYRVDPATQYATVAMNDEGTGADTVAKDGVFSATIPGQAAGKIVAFYLEADDSASPPARATYPREVRGRECLVRFGETRPVGALGTYRMWMTQETFNLWSSRSKLDNTPLNVSFVYNDERVVHGVGALYAGSPHISPGYNTPSGNLCGYSLVFPSDEPFLGAKDVVLDWPGRDTTAMQEPIAYWIARELRISFNHRRFVHLHVNGVTDTQRRSIYEDAQQVNGDLIESWLPQDTDGDLYKIEQWFEFTDSVGTSHVGPPRLENYTTTGGKKKLARYRWSWLKRAVRGSANDYQSLFDLVDVLNTPNELAYPGQVEHWIDLEQWMRIFATEHIVVNLDSYGYDIGKNMYAYKPPQGKWQLYMWDIDWVMLASAQHGYSAQSPLMYLGSSPFGESNRDPTIGRMYRQPQLQRAYWRAIQDAVDGPLLPERIHARLDAFYAALTANGVTVSSGGALAAPTAVKTWLSQRRAYLQAQLRGVAAPFRITSNAGADFSTNRNLAILEGTAPVQVKEIRVNGATIPVSWATVTNWTAPVPLVAGLNTLRIEGYDPAGQGVPGASVDLRITFTGISDRPENHLVINEIMYHPELAGSGFVEIHNTSSATTFDLSGYRLDGADGVFPSGTVLLPGGFVVMANDRTAFARAYGTSIAVAGEFEGRLNNRGETLWLVQPDASASSDRVVDQVTYADTPPWPVEADGRGPSLQLIDPSQDNRRVANWAAVGAAAIAGPETLIQVADSWKYNQTGVDPGPDWKELGFNDNPWPSGRGLLYVESSSLPGPKNTPLTLGATTYYFRAHFSFEGNPSGVLLKLTTIIDDGAIVYLNGHEVYRLGMPTGPVTSSTFAARNAPDATQEGPFILSAEYLNRGDNVLAVEVHQVNASSTDITFGLALESVPNTVTTAYTPGVRNSVFAGLPVLPKLWINELALGHSTGIEDGSGDRDPWIELFNAETHGLDLSSCFLSDNYTNLAQWAFPSNTWVDPGGYLLVWLDGEPGESSAGELHASFRLPPHAGSVALVLSSNNHVHILDYADYSNLGDGHSFGWMPDGNIDRRQILLNPTPRSANNADAQLFPVWINEWMAANTLTFADPADGDFEDWFELHNPNPIPVDLTGFFLTDDPQNLHQFTIPNPTVIAPGGYLLVWADEETEQNSAGNDLHVNFKLNRDGETILLLAPNDTILDSISYNRQSDDVSEGRSPDGGPPPFLMMHRPTPRASNIPDDEPPGDVIQILAIAQTPDHHWLLSWSAKPGRVYRLQFKDRLQDASWQDLPSDITATADTATQTDTRALGGQQGYYRILEVP